jgi:hypothetical protein
VILSVFPCQIRAPPLEHACLRRFPATMGSGALVSTGRGKTVPQMCLHALHHASMHVDESGARLVSVGLAWLRLPPSDLFCMQGTLHVTLLRMSDEPPFALCDRVHRADFVSSAGQCTLCAPSPSPPPTNDPFAGAITITSGQTVFGSTVNATRETGEPVPGKDASASIWYRFSAPATAPAASGPFTATVSPEG